VSTNSLRRLLGGQIAECFSAGPRLQCSPFPRRLRSPVFGRLLHERMAPARTPVRRVIVFRLAESTAPPTTRTCARLPSAPAAEAGRAALTRPLGGRAPGVGVRKRLTTAAGWLGRTTGTTSAATASANSGVAAKSRAGVLSSSNSARRAATRRATHSSWNAVDLERVPMGSPAVFSLLRSVVCSFALNGEHGNGPKFPRLGSASTRKKTGGPTSRAWRQRRWRNRRGRNRSLRSSDWARSRAIHTSRGRSRIRDATSSHRGLA
jgi:hypothetical protein